MSDEATIKYKGYDAVIGRVRSLSVGIEDHGILTFFVHLDFNGTAQGFGGYSLDSYDENTEKRCGHFIGSEIILRLLRVFGVEDIMDIKGKPIMALYDHREKYSSRIIGLAPLPSDKGEDMIMDEIIAYAKQHANLEKEK